MQSQSSALACLSPQYKPSSGMLSKHTNIQTNKKTCFVRPQYPCTTSPSRGGYKVSPTQDSDLSAQLVSVKVWLRIPAPRMFPTLLSADQNPQSVLLPAPQAEQSMNSTGKGGVPTHLGRWESSPPLHRPHSLDSLWVFLQCLSGKRGVP